MKKLLLVLNPCSGTRKASKSLAEIVSVFNRAGYMVDTYITAEQGDATRVVAERGADTDLIVCCGGDGTYNETVSGMMANSITTPIGYIPAGSTNDFANSLKLPTNCVKAAQSIVDGELFSYDVGKFADRYFTYVASFGAFTKTSYATPQNVKNALGHVAYVLEGMQEITQLRSLPVRLELDGQIIEDNFLFGAICNSTSLGGLLTLDPKQVDMSDGLFEVFLVRTPKSLAEFHECLWSIQRHQYNCRCITFCSAASIKITANADMAWTLDGERAPGAEQIQIQNLHNAIRLRK